MRNSADVAEGNAEPKCRLTHRNRQLTSNETLGSFGKKNAHTSRVQAMLARWRAIRAEALLMRLASIAALSTAEMPHTLQLNEICICGHVIVCDVCSERC